MRLSHLFPNDVLTHDPVTTTLCEDSRRVHPGAIFFAHAGSRDDGRKYLRDAIMAGCVAIVVPKGTQVADIPESVPVIHADNTRLEISRAAALFYPKKPEKIVAVTGTSGKTSTTYFVQQILNMCGVRTVSVGTIGVAGYVTRAGTLTTPEAPELHQLLHNLADEGVEAVAIEASSQALDQRRMDHVPLQAGAFTNLSRDHLDYHGSLENYLAAKTRLFGSLLPSDGVAVLNADDSVYHSILTIAQEHGQRTLTFGRAGKDLVLIEQNLTPGGQKITFRYDRSNYALNLDIVGAFQAGNLLAAFGLCLALGVPFSDIVAHAPKLHAPPGRMQNVPGHPHGAAIYVDYAHKPDALENVLTGLRAHKPKRLICVFGCGGDRDSGKRLIMGEIAARLATDVIVTDDNPRSENPDQIRTSIIAACPTAQNIGDRRAAITAAINMAQSGDIVVIAGKGHEQGQKFADRTDPFDDVEVALSAIRSLSSSINSPSLLHVS